MKKTEKISVLGLGYIGLPTAALLASQKRFEVLGVDISDDVVATINQGNIHIVEPDLDELVRQVVEQGKLTASSQAAKSSVYLIAVPTPFKEQYQPDLSYIKSAIESIVPYMEEGNLIIIESTSPVGTTEKVQAWIADIRPDLKNIHLAYCPERVLPGNVMHELIYNDRVIGGMTSEATEKAVDFYASFVKGALHKTNARTAEMCKLVENAARDGQIAFANELSILCDKANINVWELIKLANKHPRINILQPGTGVGGHCIAVDPWFIVSDFPEQTKMIRLAREINNYKTQWVIEKIKNIVLAFELENKKKPKVACLGLSFKADIDDLRESPAVYVVESLLRDKIHVLAVEPHIEKHSYIELVSVDEALNQCDIVFCLVKHTVFNQISLDDWKDIYDFCGLRQ